VSRHLMKKLLLFVPCLLLLCASPICGESWHGLCVRVIDGDTIVVSRNGESIKVRLHGIDCPERGQAYGPRPSGSRRHRCSASGFVLNPEARIGTAGR